MSELKVYHCNEWHNEYTEFYMKSEADKVIDEITEGAISMFRCSESCRGLDLKSPLGKIANIAFKHWNSVELIQNKNTQLQADKKFLHEYQRQLLAEIERLKENGKRRERYHKYKRCLAMAKYCESMRGHYLSYEEPKWFWYRKWSERWLELAEKFKPNSTAQ